MGRPKATLPVRMRHTLSAPMAGVALQHCSVGEAPPLVRTVPEAIHTCSSDWFFSSQRSLLNQTTSMLCMPPPHRRPDLLCLRKAAKGVVARPGGLFGDVGR